MRIGIDATALPPQPVGAGNYIIQLIRALATLECGDEFVIFAQHDGASLINVHDDDGIEWVILSNKSPGMRLMWEQVSFPRLIQRAQVDLLHSLHYSRPVWLPCKSVVTYHDMTFFLYPHLHTLSKRIFFPMAIRASARQADALLAVSESTRQDAIAILRIPADKITTTQLGVAPSFKKILDNDIKLRIAEKYKLPDKFILYVGLVEPRKNLPLLINAYKKSVNNGVEQKLVLVGRYGWMYKEVFHQIEVLNLKDKVVLTGYIPQEDLPMVYNLASLFVYPTLYEGFGLPALEAMACGLPVISTNISSLPEIIGDAGVLVPPDDVDSLFQAMQLVLNDEKLSEDLTYKGLKQAAKFTWEQTARSTLDVYRKVMETG